ncbi:hypothetical protein [Halalkalicoccus jeotgali]|uniref:Uncharacterized protein n=1 Tax=Halalkalicoccus jeotgali (strain DSM 18796 / CECT 7217 / JCM 14584 / KCTC 4019 / B3) TaxID=795797 RepID=D8J499_HALJB|nr:hypothetical protein [Halalkalicoccus jeotgali]ADJ13461.1 hypothetical protein HacjB3_00340 [Halalkalicoccus jeotgali B3]ELY33064.1 hypothetical protein C497_18992 [Halalkalicoccus jeotgali B3]
MEGTTTPATGVAIVFAILAVGLAIALERLLLGGEFLIEAVLTAIVVSAVFAVLAYSLDRF